jgi:hypothetical protein
MAGFLDNYGAGDERRARNIKIVVVSVVVAAILTGLLYFFFRNYRQEHQVKRFYELLAAHDYQKAYDMWVTSEAERQGYPMSAFMQDWGPQAMDLHGFDILDAESCGNSVIVDADLGSLGDRKIWVNRKTLELGFPPWDQCPHQNRIYTFYRDVKYHLHGRSYK